LKLRPASLIALAIQVVEHFHMRARGDFRHHAAIG